MAKTRIDLEVKELKERKDTIGKIMNEILEDMTRTSRERIEKYVKEDVVDEEDPTTLDEAREQFDWLFIFEAARETHMFQGAAGDRVLMFEKQEQEKEYLSRLKHVSGDFNRVDHALRRPDGDLPDHRGRPFGGSEDRLLHEQPQ